MMVGVQKRLAAEILGCSKGRVVFEPERLAEIKEAITKADLRALIGQGAVRKLPVRGISRARIKFAKQQKRKNRRKGYGSRKGAAGARTVRKTVWVNKVRLQRRFLKRLRSENRISGRKFSELYNKIKGGFFRSKRHMELYLTESGILKAGAASTKTAKAGSPVEDGVGGNL
ncbi:MAG: 50S ribosomal protein L19e [Nanoarchaeota archaeon]